jgi:hypothetical protein
MLIHSRSPDKTSGYFLSIDPTGTPENQPSPWFSAFANGFQVCAGSLFQNKGDFSMEFFNSAVDVLKTLVVALGAGLGVWGAVNLMEGYGGDNPSAKSQGMKQLMAGGGVALIGITLIPLLSGLFG